MASQAGQPDGDGAAVADRFAVSARTEDGAAVLTLEGELDHDTAPLLRDALAAPPADQGPRVLVDCAGLRFCDSTGLNVLLRARLAAQERDATLELAGLAPQVARVFEITGADAVFPLHASVAEALAAGGRE